MSGRQDGDVGISYLAAQQAIGPHMWKKATDSIAFYSIFFFLQHPPSSVIVRFGPPLARVSEATFQGQDGDVGRAYLET